MKRVLSNLRSLFASNKFKKFLVALLIFGLGVGTGVVIIKATQKNSLTTRNSTSIGSSLTAEQRQARSLERLEEGYNRAKERIGVDVEAKRLTQEQADKISAKLDEMYNYRKANPDTSSDQTREELQNKRQEWRNWIEDNDASSRYFIGVL